MRPVRLTAAAERDIADAVLYFERQREGLGVRFLECVDEAIEKIARTPLAYGMVIRDVRKVRTRKFRYNIWYRVLSDESIVIGCIHTSRDPRVARERAYGVIEFPKRDEAK